MLFQSYYKDKKKKLNTQLLFLKSFTYIYIMKEIWKQIDDTKYEVSNKGRVKNTKTGRVLKAANHPAGYLAYCLSNKGKSSIVLTHRLVAKAFLANPENKDSVNHIDGDKKNNCVENLEWMSHAENMKHAYDTGLKKRTLTKDQALEIRRLYDEGVEIKDIAKQFSVQWNTARQVAKRLTYKHF